VKEITDEPKVVFTRKRKGQKDKEVGGEAAGWLAVGGWQWVSGQGFDWAGLGWLDSAGLGCAGWSGWNWGPAGINSASFQSPR